MNILIGAPSSIPTPATGSVNLFINTDDNNILSYKTESGSVARYNANDNALEECCSCEIAKQWSDRVTCALKSGLLSATEFGTIMSNGLTVTTTEVNGTCTVTIGTRQDIPASITVDGPNNIDGMLSRQYTATVLPASASQSVIWISSDPSVATVDSNGLVTAVSAPGATIIYAYSAVNPAVFGSKSITTS